MIFVSVITSGPASSNRLGFRVGEMPKQKRADAQQNEHDAEKSQTAHNFPNAEQVTIIR